MFRWGLLLGVMIQTACGASEAGDPIDGAPAPDDTTSAEPAPSDPPPRGTDSGTEAPGARPTYERAPSRRSLIVSHHPDGAGTYVRVDADELTVQARWQPEVALGEFIALASPPLLVAVVHDVRAPGIVVVREDDFTPAPGSPYALPTVPTAVAHDPVLKRLYVHSVGAAKNPKRSQLAVFDTSALPFVEVPGSPFAIDVAALSMLVDPLNGHLFGRSNDGYWAVRVEADGIRHLEGSPVSLSGSVSTSGVALDVEGRRILIGERRTAAPQRIHVRDSDSFAVLQSPVLLDGGLLGDLVFSEPEEEVFAVDLATQKLFRLGGRPLALRPMCDAYECRVGASDGGLALDPVFGRLFLAIVPSLEKPAEGYGHISVWDVAGERAERIGRVPMDRFPSRLQMH